MSDIDQRRQKVKKQVNIILEQQPPLSNLHQISEPVRDFVGRETEINALLAAFDGAGQGAVISGVRGMGGVGKTELAKVLAKRLKERFPEGQITFNLRGASDDDSSKPASPVEALQYVIWSFHPDARLPEGVDELKGFYHSVLEGKRVLLLMDNALNAQQLAPLTPPPDGCALMFTSRQHFALPGMTEIDLKTLPPGEARQLLLEICPRIGEQADALATRCGYLPLALRLAASALKTHPTLGVEKYLNDLGTEQGRLATLDEYKDSTNEARGIGASLTISYRLLNKRQQRCWRALAVFPGEFDAGAAGTVWQKNAEKPLADLYAASMVLWDQATNRFRLHDLARDYACAQLSEEERAGNAQRHAEHYVGVIRRTSELYLKGGDAMLQGLALLDREWGNIRAGQAWAAAHWEADNTATELCSNYADAGTHCLSLRLHSRDRIVWLETALDAARKLEDRQGEGIHLSNLGSSYKDLGQTHKALEYHEQSLDIARKIGDRLIEGASLGNLGSSYKDFGEIRKAVEFYEQALVIAREIGDRYVEEMVLGNLGSAYAALGETRKGIEYYEQAFAIAREIGNRRGEGIALNKIGNAYADLGETQRAIEYHEQALYIAREISDRRGEGHALHSLGNTYAALGETRKAIECHEQSLDITREICDRRSEGATLGSLGNAYADLGETRKAIESYEQDLGIAREIDDRHGEGTASGNLGIAFATLGETPKAIKFYEQHLAIARETGDRLGEGNALHNLAGAVAKTGRRDEAIAYAEQALKIYDQIESPHAAKARAQLELLRK